MIMMYIFMPYMIRNLWISWLIWLMFYIFYDLCDW